ncbi:endonuclease/exonuclease/phosphatase family protein [Kribbella sp. GL6]|uniref:endonuclease/exonuclease/phosphatase family protein n=1 Tax=Kribbella sp. GL6 TaxID=3419765 RepID=UPI003CFE0D76
MSDSASAGVAVPSAGLVRVATWNLWWRFGDWHTRVAGIRNCLESLQPDILGLQEAWVSPADDQVRGLAEQLGYHHASVPAPSADHWHRRLPSSAEFGVANAVLSRWPIVDVESTVISDGDAADGRTALLVTVATPYGPWAVCCTQLTSAVVGGSATRARQLDRLTGWLAERPVDGPRLIVGDLNAEPDSDELRRLGGHKTLPYHPGQVWIDAWRYRDDLDPGYTWRRDNPHVAATNEPSARIDYILFDPVTRNAPAVDRISLFGTGPVDGGYASDHAGVVADFIPRGKVCRQFRRGDHAKRLD